MFLLRVAAFSAQNRMNKAEKIALIGHRYVLIRISRALEPASNFQIFTLPFRVVSPPAQAKFLDFGFILRRNNCSFKSLITELFTKLNGNRHEPDIGAAAVHFGFGNCAT